MFPRRDVRTVGPGRGWFNQGVSGRGYSGRGSGRGRPTRNFSGMGSRGRGSCFGWGSLSHYYPRTVYRYKAEPLF